MTTVIRPVKTLLGLLILCISSPWLAAQDPPNSAIKKANSNPPSLRSPYSSATIPHKPLIKPTVVDFNLLPGNIPSNQYFASAQIQRSSDASCEDSSFLKIFEAENRAYTFLVSTKTKDGGILLGGYGRSQLQTPPYLWYGVVTKFDSVGGHIWSKELKSDVIEPGMYVESITELSDGNIIISGWHDNPLSTSPPAVNADFFAAKLTPTGDLVWFKTFHSLMGTGTCTTSNIRFVWAAEGTNGDLYMGGTIANCPDPRYVVVFKLNSAGDLVWKYNFTGHFSRSYCLGISYDAGRVTVISLGDGATQQGVSVDFVRLDAATGTYLSHKSWEPSPAFPSNYYASFTNWVPAMVRLNNGNFCIYGNTFGDFFNPLNGLMPHFAVVEFNNNYDFVKGYTINSNLLTNPYDSKIKVDRFGRVIYGMTVHLNYPDYVKYYGIADNGNILHQRQRAQNGHELFYDNAELFDDGSVVYINNLATVGQSNFYLYYTLMHVTDTGSQCLGTVDNFSSITALNYKPNNVVWTAPNPNPLVSTNNQGNSVTPIVYTAPPPCYEKSACDTLKIHGDTSSCDQQQGLIFTAFKNPQCGARVNWVIDSAVLQSFKVINDTTVELRFNSSWRGWLYAKLLTPCGELTDSVLLTITASPGPVNIGPDTTICESNSLLLNAHRGYTTYLWNNGASDSIISITVPGIYYVDVTDSCGNYFSDTVLVALAPPISMSIGPDRTKCNSDTLQLQAPAGFMNYAWSPNYNISAINTQQVIINPAVDTVYTLIAEKTPGCFAYDTVQITVNSSPQINLGPDQGFCTGDSLVLDAGTGFTQYQWNNGSASQLISVNSTGSYSVLAITAEGCRSSDSLIVSTVYPLPVVSLNDDSTLCTGDQRTLNAGSGFVNYSWNTGSTFSSIVINNIGIYSVTVTDSRGCKGGDTTAITFMLQQPSGFLGPDTAKCSYGDLQLKTITSFNQYTWSTGGSASAITIKQPGVYWLQVKDNNGCTGKDTIVVNPKDCGKGFFVPTAFTPNNDGKNDLIKPILLGNVIQYRFSVYNRWGQLIFETTDLNQGWDGTYKGQAQGSGAFVWRCMYQFENETVKNEKGTFVLIR